MPMRKITFLKNSFYHIYNRGVDKRMIFEEDLDYLRFLFLLLTLQSNTPLIKPDRLISRWFKIYKKGERLHVNEIVDGSWLQQIMQSRKASLIAFALMPNHFHLLLQAQQSDGISSYMQRVLNSYTKFFNTKYERSGHLFQGPFQAVEITSTEQMEYVSAYIHRNPREIKGWTTKEHLYPWSSYQDYIEENRWDQLLAVELIFDKFKTKKEYDSFVKQSGAKSFKWEIEF